MVNLDNIKSIIVFFKEFVWGKVNIKAFLYEHRLVLFTGLACLLLFLMYVYFAEQTIIRTAQYRDQKEQIQMLEENISALETKNEDLQIKINYLSNIELCPVDVQTTKNKLVADYDIWLSNIRDTSEQRRKRNQERRNAALERRNK